MSSKACTSVHVVVFTISVHLFATTVASGARSSISEKNWSTPRLLEQGKILAHVAAALDLLEFPPSQLNTLLVVLITKLDPDKISRSCRHFNNCKSKPTTTTTKYMHEKLYRCTIPFLKEGNVAVRRII
jgi:hypothetical protein